MPARRRSRQTRGASIHELPNVYKPVTTPYQPARPMFEPVRPAYEPAEPAYEPETPAFEDESPAYEPDSPEYESPGYEPEHPAYEPGHPAYEPDAPRFAPSRPRFAPTGYSPAAYLAKAAPRPVLEACRSSLMRATGTQSSHIAVTSALPGEGRSTVALGMAVVQQRDLRHRTLLVELDVAHPSLAARLGLAPTPGIAEMVRDDVPIEECLRFIDEDLALLPAGDAGGEPLRVLSELMRGDRLRQLQMWCEVMVADLPPVLSSSPTVHLARLFPTLMLVVRAGATPAPRVEEAIAELPVQPTVLLNGVESRVPRWLRRLTGS